jgi:F-type H+-transporting ATPase subunit a
MFNLFGTYAYAAEASHEGAEGGISIHLASETLGTLFGIPITNTLLTTWLAMGALIILAIAVRASLARVPGKLQSLFEMIVGFAYTYVKDTLGNEARAKKFFPIIMTIFLFVLAINWIAQVPGLEALQFNGAALFHAGTADLNITLAFALIAFVTIEFAGILALGTFTYLGKFFNFHSPLGFVIGLIELISELARLISFAFRLFGNIFAGKVLLLVVAFFVPFVLPVPLMAFEVFVGFIQAFVFAILTLFFIKAATEMPH